MLKKKISTPQNRLNTEFLFCVQNRMPYTRVSQGPPHPWNSPITLSSIDYRSLVGGLNPQLPLSRLEVPLKGVNTTNVKPHELLQRPRGSQVHHCVPRGLMLSSTSVFFQKNLFPLALTDRYGQIPSWSQLQGQAGKQQLIQLWYTKLQGFKFQTKYKMLPQQPKSPFVFFYLFSEILASGSYILLDQN